MLTSNEGIEGKFSWTNGKLNGKGISTDSNGTRYEVECEDNKLISSVLVAFPVLIKASLNHFFEFSL